MIVSQHGMTSNPQSKPKKLKRLREDMPQGPETAALSAPIGAARPSLVPGAGQGKQVAGTAAAAAYRAARGAVAAR